MKIKKHKIIFEKGSAIMIVVLFMLAFSLTVVYGVATPVLRDVKVAKESERSRQAFLASESGSEDTIFRMANNMTFALSNTLSIDETTAITTVDVSDPSNILVISIGDSFDAIRKTTTTLTTGDGISFNFGVQAGEGGLVLQNSSSILGNINSDGIIQGSGSNVINGSAVSTGPTGSISGIHVTDSAFAHTISNSTIDNDAYYQTISGTSVGGTLYPNSPDQPTSQLPISDEQIEEWKLSALSGGIINSPCPYKIRDAISIGPVKINCDVEISGTNFNIDLTGHIWVDGNIDIKNSPTLRVDSSLPNKSIVIVADNDSNRSSSGMIELENSAIFEGNGEKSYILMLSKNNSASTGGYNSAIEVQNSVDGDLLVYAGDGEITLANSVNLKEVTAYKIRLKNSAEVIYESGLINVLFNSGPSGGFSLNSWAETE
jgi:hypothetical protein